MNPAFLTAFDAIASQSAFGNSPTQLLLFTASVLLCLAIGTISFKILKIHARKIADKPANKIDNVILETLDKSFFLLLFVIGLVIGIQFLSIDSTIAKDLQAILGTLTTILSAWLLIKFVDAFTEHYIIPTRAIAGQRIDENLLPVFKNIFKVIILAIAAIMILNSFGYNVTAILAGLGIGGIAIAFAAQQTIADIFGGVSLLTSKPFIVGDTIQVENVTGTVRKVGIRTTRIKGLDNSEITFSNAKLANAIIKNLSSGREQRVEMNIGIPYNTPHEKVQAACETLKKIILVHEDCADNPIVFFSEFKDHALNINVIYFIKEKDWMQTKHEINMKILEEFNKRKIEFAFPTQTIRMEK